MSALADSEYILGHLGTVIGVGWAVNVGANDGGCELGWVTRPGEPVFRAVQVSPLELVKRRARDFRIGSPFTRCRSTTIRMACSTGNQVITFSFRRTDPLCSSNLSAWTSYGCPPAQLV